MEQEVTWLTELTRPQRNHLSVECVSSRAKQNSFVPKLAGPPCTENLFSDFSSVVRSLLRCCEHTLTWCPLCTHAPYCHCSSVHPLCACCTRWSGHLVRRVTPQSQNAPLICLCRHVWLRNMSCFATSESSFEFELACLLPPQRQHCSEYVDLSRISPLSLFWDESHSIIRVHCQQWRRLAKQTTVRVPLPSSYAQQFPPHARKLDSS